MYVCFKWTQARFQTEVIVYIGLWLYLFSSLLHLYFECLSPVSDLATGDTSLDPIDWIRIYFSISNLIHIFVLNWWQTDEYICQIGPRIEILCFEKLWKLWSFWHNTSRGHYTLRGRYTLRGCYTLRGRYTLRWRPPLAASVSGWSAPPVQWRQNRSLYRVLGWICNALSQGMPNLHHLPQPNQRARPLSVLRKAHITLFCSRGKCAGQMTGE